MIKTTLTAGLLALMASTGAFASDWKYGIGTGLQSFSLDGDLGFATPLGGFIADIDLDNGDTSDLMDSAFGGAGFATNGTWTFQLAAGTVSLEDNDADLRAKWDRTNVEFSAVYNFAETGNHRWGVLGGVRYTKHEWEISSRNGAFADVKPDDDWTDFIIGLTHAVPFAEKWSWTNRIDAGFGDTEEAYQFVTAINWQPYENWVFNLNGKYVSTEFGDKSDINKNDFYYYDVDEPSIGLGFMYVW